jgi:hypothetical protein
MMQSFVAGTSQNSDVEIRLEEHFGTRAVSHSRRDATPP